MLEYQVLGADSLASQEQLTKMNYEEGWELITIIPEDGKYFFYFKRQLARN